MSEPFLAELKIVSFNFAPKGWAMCNGQLLPINQNQALFALLGTTYGGDGQTTFALPDLRSRCATHFGSGFTQGQRAGEEAHTLSISEMPQHTHQASATGADADAPVASGGRLASFNNGYRAPAALTTLSASTIGNVGGSQPHQNMSPYLVLNYIIALQGIFPSQN
jgi:microcystin-dependent protein